MDTLPTTFCHTIHGCHSYCAIHGTSIDGHLGWHLLSKYPWMPQLLCHPWVNTLPTTFCQSIHKCLSYCAIHGPSMDTLAATFCQWMPQLLCHPWTIHEWTPWLPPSVKVSVDATATVPSMDGHLAYHGTFCQSICESHSYCAIHGASMDGLATTYTHQLDKLSITLQ